MFYSKLSIQNYDNVLFSFIANDVTDKKINATSNINMNKVIAKSN